MKWETAWLVDRVALRAGQKVLVLGGGGVGNMAVRIARATHAPVYVTTSASKADYMRGLGATPIDLSSMSVEEAVATYTDGKGFDIVYDTLGGSSLDSAFSVVGRFGHVVSCLGWGTHALSTLSFKVATLSRYASITGISLLLRELWCPRRECRELGFEHRVEPRPVVGLNPGSIALKRNRGVSRANAIAAARMICLDVASIPKSPAIAGHKLLDTRWGIRFD